MKTKKVLTDPSTEKHLHGHKKCVSGLSFEPQSKQLVSSSHDHSLMLWNLKDKMRAFKFLGHTDIVSDVCFSTSGKLMASSSFDRTVRLWTPTVAGTSSVFTAHTKAVQSVHFSHDSLTLLTASNDRFIKEWSVVRKTFLSTFTGHTNWVKCARFSHDARTVVSASDDKTVKLFDRQSHQCVHTFNETRVPQKAIFHPNDIYVAAALSNKSIKVYDLRMLKQLQLYQCHEDDVTSVEFHPNGNYLFSTSSDGTSKIIDLLEGRTLYTLEGNRGPLTAVALSYDGEYFAIGGLDGQILVWKNNFDNVMCEDDEIEDEPALDRESVKLRHSRITDNFTKVGLDDSENKENVQMNANISGLKPLTLKDDSYKIETGSGDDFKSLSQKMDAVLEIMHKMKGQLASLDERCRKLEDMHLKSHPWQQ